MKRLFISGKITNESVMPCVHKFQKAATAIYIRNIGERLTQHKLPEDLENYLEGNKVEAINPLEIEGINFGIGREYAMILCLDELKYCDAIYMLKDWERSDGAKEEHQFALDNGLKIFYQ